MSKVIKRKPCSHIVCIDLKKKNAQKKPPTKKELEQENKALKHIIEALEEVNKVNIDKIKSLEEKVSALQNLESIGVIQAETQTEDEDLHLRFILMNINVSHVKRFSQRKQNS